MPAAADTLPGDRIPPMDQPRRSLLDRCLAARDRLLASPGFQRWASAFPLTQPMARRQAQGLFDLCAGFVYSQVLQACVRLDLFRILGKAPMTLPELAERTGLTEEATQRLVRAASSLGLLEARTRGRYGLGMKGAALLGNPGIAAMIEHHAMVYADLADPVALLKGDKSNAALAAYWPYAAAKDPAAIDSVAAARYTELMAVSQGLIAADILDAYPLARHHRLLDIGGGDGTFLTHAAAANPHLEICLFDLPAVAAQAHERFASAGLGRRATSHGGDFKRDPLPEGADVVSLVRVLLDHDDATAVQILTAARRALAPSGVLLIAEPVSGTSGAETMSDAYFGFYLMAMGRGRTRTLAEHARLLAASGFGAPTLLKTRRPLLTQLIKAATAQN